LVLVCPKFQRFLASGNCFFKTDRKRHRRDDKFKTYYPADFWGLYIRRQSNWSDFQIKPGFNWLCNYDRFNIYCYFDLFDLDNFTATGVFDGGVEFS